MGKKQEVKKGGRKKTAIEDGSYAEKPHFWEVMDPATLRGIGGVLLFVFAVILLLAVLGLAGVIGDKLYHGLYFLVGVGYYLLPIMLIGWAWSLFNSSNLENTLRPLRSFGAGMFFVASLAMVGALSTERAGILGAVIARPMLQYLDMIATLVILAGAIIVSLLLLFDSELWVLLWRKLLGLFIHSKETGTNEDTTLTADTVEELEHTEHAYPAPASSMPIEEPRMHDGEGDEDDTEIDEIFTPAPTNVKTIKRAPAFEPPSEYVPPPLSLLEGDKGKPNVGDTKARSNIIKKTLQHFKIPVEMDEITVGPTVTQYSLKPAAGVRLNKIVGLQSNLELALAASPLRIEAPIPGRSLVGIEVPNTAKATVGLGSLLASPEFTEETVPLFVTLGKDIAGAAHYANISKMPHLLVAGTTGSGKSVMIHSIITSLLYRNSPERLRLILIDPKRVELTLYDGIPHLLTPVITDAKRCILALKWAAKEMDRRYDLLRENKVQDINGYHNEVVQPALSVFEKQKAKGKDVSDFEMPEGMPHMVIIIDELADIMTSYPRELEGAIVRLAQMSRAVGIHLILSTQRPSAQVITGLIKANIPTRIALKVSSLLESRIILDQSGAEKLLGAGDMLYLGGDMAKPRRIQSPFLTNAEVKKIAEFLRKNNNGPLDAPIDFSGAEGNGGTPGGNSAGLDFEQMEANNDLDQLYEEARALVIMEQKVSTSMLQRRFKMGYGRAARVIDQLHERGVISPTNTPSKPWVVTIPSGSTEHREERYGTSAENDRDMEE
ncbi:MAG: DNA translocase FtsK 4TM domain-containing protein [Candidatus Pacebacteria bacterium]|nr:DNA translocase FtsK 4TM domain-containing protein [Candidatus Paceibacterota bacterium]